ncbi:MAG TPA: FG-GAP-like repeat-containing protein, partial [Anaerolineales bacterium]|nr:FG-GAP-like repeat-containing protein [Anaerolineales bacterium]
MHSKAMLILAMFLLVGAVTLLFVAEGRPPSLLTPRAYEQSLYYVHVQNGIESSAGTQRLFWLTLVSLLALSVAVPVIVHGIALILRWRRSRARTALPASAQGVFAAGALIGMALAAFAFSLFPSAPATAYDSFPGSLPNGSHVFATDTSPEGCQMCHVYVSGIRQSSSYTNSFSSAIKPFFAGQAWGGHGAGSFSPAHNVDTDGDGFTNGEELQDPDGTWVYNAATSNYRDTAYASNANDAARYPPAPSITTTVGLTNGQTISTSTAVYVTMRYAALNRVVYSFRNPAGVEVYSYTVNSPSLTNYANYYCLGTSPATTSSCAPWDPGLAPNGLYTVTVTAYDRRRVGGVSNPQTGALVVANVTITSTTRYVAPNGSDTNNNCTSVAAPCASVQRAVDQATSGGEVHVAAGTYTGVASRAGSNQMVYIDKSVIIRGGYTTANWAVSDPGANPTILNAQGQGRVFFVTGSINVTLEGLRITGGNASTGGGADFNGGGIRIATAQVNLIQSMIYNNTAGGGVGGGVLASSSPTTLNNNTIMSNTAGYGAGVGLEQSNQAVLESNIFISNTAGVYGGGIRLNQSNARLTNNVFIDNYAGYNGGGGVGVWQSQPALVHNTFIRNASVDGAAVNVFPGTPTAIAVLTNTIVVSHTGTAIVADGGTTADLNGVLWFGNQTDTGGSVTYGTTGTITIANAYTGDPAFAADGYHMTDASAALDRGVSTDVSNDIDGDPRPLITAPDLGADEFVPIPLSSVTVSGPTLGFTNIGYGFTAAVSPTNPTMPVTYTWQAADQAPIVNVTTSLMNTVVYTWTTEGSKSITVTATNPAGSVFGSYLWTSIPASAGGGFGFSFAGLVGAGADTRSMAAGDFNDDGALDVVIGYPGASAQVYVNDGQGGFASTATLGTGTASGGVGVGDFNGDGKLDVALTNSGAATQVFLNNGSGGFPTVKMVGGAASGRSLGVGDFNGDGKLDIVLGYVGQAAQVFLNDGSGNFSAGGALGSLSASASTTTIAVGDVNGDGPPDIVLGNFNQSSQVFLNANDGAGSFNPGSLLGSGVNSTNVAVGDLTGDGALDIVLDTLVYPNDGAGNFPSSASIGNGGSLFSATVGDVNGDGALDIVVGNGFTRPTQIYLNNGGGGFTLALTLGSGAFTRSLVVADFNGDAALDIVLGNSGQPNQLFLNNGVIGFTSAGVLGSGANTYGAAVGDFNGDAALDILLANSGATPSAIYWNDRTGRFPTSSALTGAPITPTTSAAVADFDGNGALDVLLGNDGQPSQVYLNNGAGVFTPGGTLGSGDATQSVAVGDVDGNGALDVALGNDGQPSRVYKNNGLGVFSLLASLGGGASTHSVALGDLNGDGALDVVLGNYQQASQVYLNNGAGQFTLKASLGGGASTHSVALGDLDGDGALDAVLGNFLEPVQVFLNDGAAQFTPGAALGSGSYTHGAALGDFNGDGALDVVLSNGFVQPSQVYLNDGSGEFRLATTLGNGGTSYGAAVGDLNGDGALDVALGNYQWPSQVFLNRVAQSARLANNPARIAVARPGVTRNANFFSTPTIIGSPAIPVTYTLYDPEGDPARFVRAYYSMDGGDNWRPAVAAGGTVTTPLSTTNLTTRGYANNTPSAVFSTLITSTLALTPTELVADVDVWLNVTHTFDWDVVATLASPSGQSVLLINQVGGDGDNFTNTILDDQASTPISLGTAPFTGRYRPEQPLSRFVDSRAIGVWTLTLQDVYPPVD